MAHRAIGLLADALAYHVEHHADTTAGPMRIKQAVKALVPFRMAS